MIQPLIDILYTLLAVGLYGLYLYRYAQKIDAMVVGDVEKLCRSLPRWTYFLVRGSAGLMIAFLPLFGFMYFGMLIGVSPSNFSSALDPYSP